MIRITLGISAGVLLLVAASVSGQDTEAKKPLPFEFKVTGDTVETFKAEFKLNAKIDQSTPEGLINSYCLLADNRGEVSKAQETAFKPIPDIIRKAEQPIRARLFTEEMAKKVAETENPDDSENKSEYGQEATEILSVTDGKDGAKLVETVQKTWFMMEGWDSETGEPTGKMEKQEREAKLRYTCSKGQDGNWRIDMVERQEQAWAGMDEEPSFEWVATKTTIHWVMERAKAGKPDELKQDTPENAALSLFNHLLRQREAWNDEMHYRALRGWMDAIMTMFSEKGLKGPEKEEGEDDTELFGTKVKREVEFVSDDADGVKRVKFKPSNEWFGAIEVYVKKEGEVWKIVKTGYYETDWDMEGNMKETDFVEEYNLDMLTWR